MTDLEDAILELKEYSKGHLIPFPEDKISLLPLPYSLQMLLSSESDLVITRRSLGHILQKGQIGEILAYNINSCIQGYDSIFISNEIKKRFIILKKYPFRDMAVVLEINPNFVVTAMIADTDYIYKKFKKLG